MNDVVTDKVEFTPDEGLQVHKEGAIQQICSQFRSHENGLPEWIKNSSDVYIRLDTAPKDSVIVVLLKNKRSGSASAVGCLDFGGMSTQDIEGKFRNWADPEAAGVNKSRIEGGHGSGGKCYMTQLFESHSYIHTLRDGRGNRYGFKAGDVYSGYFPSEAEGREYEVEDADAELAEAISPFEIAPEKLPVTARQVWEQRKSFTLVVGFGAKHVNGKIPATRWVENLSGHQQMVQSLQLNKVFVIHNGQVISHANPIELPKITPIPGAETARVIAIPEELTDPATGEAVNTGSIEGESRLELRTSEVSMRRKLKSRHTVNGWAKERTTGFWDVHDLSLNPNPYTNKIYGDIYFDALADYRQNDRRNHTVAPLTRAIKEWIEGQIDKYSVEFLKLDKLQTTREEKDELKRMNEAFNQWKNGFLKEEFGGVGIRNTGGTGGGRSSLKLPRGKPAHLEISLSHTKAGQGVSFRPSLKFFDESRNRIRAVPHIWKSSDWEVATVDDKLNRITTCKPGVAEISVVCKDSGLQSNIVQLEVLDILGIDLNPTEIEMGLGGRAPITAKVHTRDGKSRKGVYLIWIKDNDTIVSVGSNGMVFGLQTGVTSVTAGDDQIMAAESTMVTVVEGGKADDKGGSGFPRILLSEINDDPLGEEPPTFGSADPPVHQRPQDVDANIWWINMGSPLAHEYYKSAQGNGTRSKDFRVYYLERVIEIMVKICLHYDYLAGEDLTFDTMLRRWDEESANMQDRAIRSLQAFLDKGDIVEVAM